MLIKKAGHTKHLIFLVIKPMLHFGSKLRKKDTKSKRKALGWGKAAVFILRNIKGPKPTPSIHFPLGKRA